MRTATAIINPEMLVWARETIGLSREEWAVRAKKTVAEIVAWENGQESMTIAQLRQFASLVKRPLATFYLAEKPTDNQPPKDFRGRQRVQTEGYDKALIVEFRKALVRREDALDLAEELEIEAPRFDLHADMRRDPEDLAATIAEYLRTNQSDKVTLRTSYDSLNYWKEKIEKAGILVFQTTRIPFQAFRGFSVSLDPVPIIVLNPADSPNGRVFTLLHEITHIVLRTSALCDLIDSELVGAHEHDVEVYCNHVAGAVLVPQKALLEAISEIAHVSGNVWSDSELAILASRFKCSREVILRRLLITGKTSQDFYAEKRREFLAGYAENAENDTTLRIPQFQKSIAANGRLFTRLVLESYKKEIITASQLSNLLAVKLQHLPKIEKAVMG